MFCWAESGSASRAREAKGNTRRAIGKEGPFCDEEWSVWFHDKGKEAERSNQNRCILFAIGEMRLLAASNGSCWRGRSTRLRVRVQTLTKFVLTPFIPSSSLSPPPQRAFLISLGQPSIETYNHEVHLVPSEVLFSKVQFACSFTPATQSERRL